MVFVVVFLKIVYLSIIYCHFLSNMSCLNDSVRVACVISLLNWIVTVH